MIRPEYRTSEFWNKVWSRPYENYIKHHLVIWKEIRERSFGEILDLGCGSASCWTGSKIVGVDFSDQAIVEAYKNCPDGEFIVSSIESVPIDKKFDTVVLNGVINYFPDLSKIRSEATRLSKNQVIVTINMLEDFPGRVWNQFTIDEEFGKWGLIREMVLFEKIAWLIRITV